MLPRLTTTSVSSLKIPTYPLPKSVLISFIFSKGNELKSSSAFSSFLNLLALATGQSLLAISTANTLRKSLQTTSTSPFRTQVQPSGRFLVCSLIFIEYNSTPAAQRFVSPVKGSFPVAKRSPLLHPIHSAAKVGSLALFSWLNFANFTLDIPHESLGEPLDTPPMSFYQFALSDPV